MGVILSLFYIFDDDDDDDDYNYYYSIALCEALRRFLDLRHINTILSE